MDKPVLKLSGIDGNAYIIIGTALKAASKAKWTQKQMDEFKSEATSGDYDHVLQTTMKYFDVE